MSDRVFDQSTNSAPAMQFARIDDFTPLSDSPAPDAPADLAEFLFGPDRPDGHLYALLDAARLTNLVEMLEGSELERDCLFQGQAYDEMKDIAPWLVRLTDDSAFARNLLTDGAAPWHLWPQEPAIFIHSPLPLPALRQHLRKFTRLPTSDGRWMFFRYWEPFHFHVHDDRPVRFPLLEQFWQVAFAGMRIAIPRVATNALLRMDLPPLDAPSTQVMSDPFRAELRTAVFYRNMVRSAQEMLDDHPEEMQRYAHSAAAIWPLLHDFADEVKAVGLNDPELRARMLLLAFVKYPEPWPAFLNLPFWQKIRQSPGQADDLFEDFCARLKHLNRAGGGPLEVWW